MSAFRRRPGPDTEHPNKRAMGSFFFWEHKLTGQDAVGNRKEVVKPTGGPEHCNDQSQCQGCFPLGYTHCQVCRNHSQVKQGCTQSALHLLRARPGMASPGSVGQMFTLCHQEAVHLYSYYTPAEKAAPPHPSSTTPH